MQKINEM